MYLIGEITASLVIAIVIGFTVGWMARGRRNKRPAKRRF